MKRLIVGIGSPHGDDQVGWRIAERLPSIVSPQTTCRKVSTPIDILALVDGVDQLVIIDSLNTNDETLVRRWNWPLESLGDVSWRGTHDWGVIATLQLGEQLKLLPNSIELWGISGLEYQPGAPLSAKLSSSFENIVTEIGRCYA